jgi:predicted negative regulator of RcsB-dependent stress response
MQGWLERNSRVIMIAVLLIFGVWLLWKGINGLIG